MPQAIQHKGETVTELQEGEKWVVVCTKIVITKPSDPTYSREIPVPGSDVEGLVEVWLGGA